MIELKTSQNVIRQLLIRVSLVVLVGWSYSCGSSKCQDCSSSPQPAQPNPIISSLPQDPDSANRPIGFPSPNESVDPRTFSVTGEFNQQPVSRQTYLYHPVCQYPFTFNSSSQLTAAVDGNADEWSLAQLVAIDRAGDGIDSGDFDIREMYWAEDTNHYYVALKLQQAWQNSEDGFFEVSFFDSAPPNAGAHMQSTLIKSYRFFLENGDLKTIYLESDGDRYLDLSDSSLVEISRSETIVEIKVLKSQITLTQKLLKIRVSSGNFDRFDSLPDHYLGLQDGYACMVEMPDGNAKMFVLRLGEGVDPVLAEIGFRAAMAASPIVEHVMQDRHDLHDTMSWIFIKEYIAGGSYAGPRGFVVQAIDHLLGAFSVTAHEYAHALNAGDYNLPQTWANEGHSEIAMLRSVSFYYGQEHTDRYLWNAKSFFLGDEPNQSTPSLESFQQLSSYHYAKAAVFYHMIDQVLPYDALLELLLKSQQNPSLFDSTTAYLAAISGHDLFSGTVSGSMWNGWFDGSYAESVFPLEYVNQVITPPQASLFLIDGDKKAKKSSHSLSKHQIILNNLRD